MKNTLILFLIAVASIKSFAEQTVICTSQKSEIILEADLKTQAFTAVQFEDVNSFQSYGETANKKVVQINGQDVLYVRAQFPDQNTEEDDVNIGWVQASLIKLSSKCPGYKEPEFEDEDENEANDNVAGDEGVFPQIELPQEAAVDLPKVEEVKKEDSISELIKKITDIKGLDDSKCCLFPMNKKPLASYLSGMRKFGSGRDRGRRKHAAADLYSAQYQPVRAIADGVVLRDRASFYLSTSVTEVAHGGGFIARYGEIASSAQKPGLRVGQLVKKGDIIGYVKKVSSRRVKFPMLHFELYKGTKTGSLTVKTNKLRDFQRRSDIMDPTKYLQKWEKSLK
ncbi:MAG: M23 family metallopeptidase [Bdellovibrionota bacterium]